ncbi:MAG: ribonuclease D [Parashewanella sp.]
MSEVTFVKDQQSFDDVMNQLIGSELVAIDTEFVRTRSYYAKLGLIQVYNGNVLALIDPVMNIDLTRFWQLLEDENTLKLLHSASEDLEVFAHYGKVQPKPYFDSQIAAALAGLGYGMGYAKLVEECLGVVVDKGESRTDWVKRPLSDKQLAYAANDVFYLFHLFPALKQKLDERNRYGWVLEEGASLCEGRLNAPDIDNAYLKVKNAFQLSPKSLSVLKPLASWRLKTAINKDLAVGFVLKDGVLIDIAKKIPKNFTELLRCSKASEYEVKRHSKAILSSVQLADFENPPEQVEVIAYRSDYKTSFKATKKVLVQIAEANEVPIELLGSKRYIHELLKWQWSLSKETPKVLFGWRGSLTHHLLNELK